VRTGGRFRRDGAERDGAERDRAARDRLGSEVTAPLRRARAADRAGDAETAIEARSGAADALRGSDIDRHAPVLGEVLFELGGSLLDGDRPAQAIGVLDEAEEAYGRVPGSGDRLADVQARRALAYGLVGAGGSAIVDAQSAVLHHRDRGRSGRRDPAAAGSAGPRSGRDPGDGEPGWLQWDGSGRRERGDGRSGWSHQNGSSRQRGAGRAAWCEQDGSGQWKEGWSERRERGGSGWSERERSERRKWGGSGRWGAARRRGLARVLAVNADVLAAYGDPDLAVASADAAVRLALARPASPDTEPLRRALAVAIAVHTAHGRHDLAAQAGAVARRLGGLTPRRPTVLRERSVVHPPLLSVTVATALHAACQRLDRQPPGIGDRAVVRPAVHVELLVPLDRVLVPLGPGGRSADAAARLGGTLARLAAELLPLDAAGGARLGLEAHALMAGASRQESELLRYQLPTLGPPWAAVLLACSRRAETGRDPALALDLAAWAAGVVDQLFPATLVDREARTVAVEVLDHHGRLLAEHGERDRARDAAQAAARLRTMSAG
jgi:hypothetical protein